MKVKIFMSVTTVNSKHIADVAQLVERLIRNE